MPSIDVNTGLPFTPEGEEEDLTELKIDANHLIDLGEAIRQQILVSIPMYPVCGDDCPGLFQYLDKLNEDFPASPEETLEEETPVDPRWSALKKIKDHLKD